MKVPQSAVGKSGKCPACQARLRLVAPGFSDPDSFDDRLTIEAGPDHVGQHILIGGPGPIDIGKLPETHVTLSGKKVSRSHCRLVRSTGGWRIEDQNSTNGTFVNQQRVRIHELSAGDSIGVGEYVLRYSTTTVPALKPPPVPVAAGAAGALLDDLYALSEGETVEVQEPVGPTADGRLPAPAAETGGPSCPSCQRSLAANAKICIHCGIDLKTGRAILTAHAGDLDAVYMRTESVIRWLSWIFPAGLYPVSSEAFGTRKPYVVYSLALLTVLTSCWFWAYEWTDSPEMVTVKNYMHWMGTAPPDPYMLLDLYRETNYGDTEAFERKLRELARQASRKDSQKAPRASETPAVEEGDDPLPEDDEAEAELILAAHHSLPPDRQAIGHYHGYQLITCAFLHNDILHLAGNLLFLLVIGSRVNALLGNVATLILYVLLAVVASMAQMISSHDLPPHPALGASGAIMGLAGLYIVLMPVYRMHVVSWLRWGLVAGFRLSMKIFSVRGFWVVLFYIAFDVVATIRAAEDGVAHWAHLGGFIGGAAVGMLLLLTKTVNARGGDLFSGLLGQRAWAVVGKPGSDRKALLDRVP